MLFHYDIQFVLSESQILSIRDEWANTLPGYRVAFFSNDSKHFPAIKLAAELAERLGEEHKAFNDRNAARHWLLQPD